MKSVSVFRIISTRVVVVLNRIRELRQDMGWTQANLADRLGVRYQAVSKYEIGALDLDTDTIRRLCEIFGCTSDYLLGISSRRESAVTKPDAELLAAYHAAPAEIRTIVDTALQPYKEKRITAAG